MEDLTREIIAYRSNPDPKHMYEFYDFMRLRIGGNGTVHFDSDVLDDEEPWLRYFARLGVAAAQFYGWTPPTDTEETK